MNASPFSRKTPFMATFIYVPYTPLLMAHDRFYGYFLSAWNHAYKKVIDEKALWIEDIPLTPELATMTAGQTNNGS